MDSESLIALLEDKLEATQASFGALRKSCCKER